MIGVDRLSSIPLAVAATSAHSRDGARLSVQDLDATTAGKPRAAATTRRAATFVSQATEPDVSRSNLLGMSPERLERVEIGFDDC